MEHKKWKSEIVTIPNLLSFLRLVLIPLYTILYLNAKSPRQFHIAGMILALSCLTDALDGKIARHFHMVSVTGKILDPLADKITQLTLILCLALRHPVLKPVLVIFIIKELTQVLLALIFLRKGKMLSGALPEGKLCTTVLFVSLTALVFFPDTSGRVVTIIALADIVFLGISLLGYGFAYFGNCEKVRNIQTE